MNKILIAIFLMFLSSNVFAATTWYVKLTGGTNTQCIGTSTAAYPGSGTGQACAFSHPQYAYNAHSGGDTIQFLDTGPYMIGYGAPLVSCSTSDTRQCYPKVILGGPDSSHRTKVYGVNQGNSAGTKTQLWGNERVYQVMEIFGNHIDIQSIELTDHSNCIDNGPFDGTQGGDPVQCAQSYPNGAYALTGLASNSASTDILLTDVDIHGLAKRGIFAYHNGDWTLTRVNIEGNGFVGWDSDGSGDDSYTGTTTLDHTKIEWNGCGEKYPLTTTNLSDSTDKHHCWSQSQGGYGDAIGLGDGDPGNWTIVDSAISHNVSDGVDLLHGSGTGTIIFARSKAEGNAGQQVKLTGTTNYIDNSIVSGNCYFFHGQTFTSTVGNYTNSGSCAANFGSWNGTKCLMGFDDCRANGNAIVFSNSVAGQIMRITNSTVLSNGDTLLTSIGSGCNGTTHLYAYNDIFRGGNDALGGDTSGLYYAAGSDGNGAGTCGSLALTEDYNQIYGTKAGSGDVTGAHSRYADPQLAGDASLKMTTSPYYQTATGIESKIALGAGSPSRFAVTGANSANESITLSSYGSNDFYNNSRGSNWDGGALFYGSTPGTPTCTDNGSFCSIGGDCCSGFCVSNACSATPACTNNGNSCSVNGDCCSGNCATGFCAAASSGGGTSSGLSGSVFGKTSTLGKCSIF